MKRRLMLVNGRLVQKPRETHQCSLRPKSYQSENDLERHIKKIHNARERRTAK